MYVGLEYGLGQEWGSTVYTGNSEAYSWLFLILMVGGLILLIGSLSRFTVKMLLLLRRSGCESTLE